MSGNRAAGAPMLEYLAAVQSILGFLRSLLDDQTYTISVEPEDEVPEVVVVSIKKGTTICFHIAATYTNPDIENAKEVCSQAVLYRSTENDPLLHFAVYDRHTQTCCFCMLDPKELHFDHVAEFQLLGQATRVAATLKDLVASNAQVLQPCIRQGQRGS
ncbi:hypothetical protein K505DRAFT_380314 [Melanomma pulvis-pyrius CBS 109.77]|uniref:Uncharacterized protein n=1 Tax=Melanomma pulvis-pyrius CBS 109.77 TaxID=1314802 RepID=A0A6A6WQZ0_9PLEO|nr:hypothetical protein K505DRAFT_380314 [Melanomma pulvis-pyrius CBS 109.77]